MNLAIAAIGLLAGFASRSELDTNTNRTTATA